MTQVSPSGSGTVLVSSCAIGELPIRTPRVAVNAVAGAFPRLLRDQLESRIAHLAKGTEAPQDRTDARLALERPALADEDVLARCETYAATHAALPLRTWRGRFTDASLNALLSDVAAGHAERCLASEDPKVRTLGALGIGLADDPGRLRLLSPLVDDESPRAPRRTRRLGPYPDGRASSWSYGRISGFETRAPGRPTGRISTIPSASSGSGTCAPPVRLRRVGVGRLPCKTPIPGGTRRARASGTRYVRPSLPSSHGFAPNTPRGSSPWWR